MIHWCEILFQLKFYAPSSSGCGQSLLKWLVKMKRWSMLHNCSWSLSIVSAFQEGQRPFWAHSHFDFHEGWDIRVSQTRSERQQKVCSKTFPRLQHFQFVNWTLDRISCPISSRRIENAVDCEKSSNKLFVAAHFVSGKPLCPTLHGNPQCTADSNNIYR